MSHAESVVRKGCVPGHGCRVDVAVAGSDVPVGFFESDAVGEDLDGLDGFGGGNAGRVTQRSTDAVCAADGSGASIGSLHDGRAGLEEFLEDLCSVELAGRFSEQEVCVHRGGCDGHHTVDAYRVLAGGVEDLGVREAEYHSGEWGNNGGGRIATRQEEEGEQH